MQTNHIGDTESSRFAASCSVILFISRRTFILLYYSELEIPGGEYSGGPAVVIIATHVSFLSLTIFCWTSSESCSKTSLTSLRKNEMDNLVCKRASGFSAIDRSNDREMIRFR